MYVGMDSIVGYSVYVLIGAGLSVFIQYYYLVYKLNIRDKLTKFKPVLLVASCIVIYIITGMIFELNYSYDSLSSNEYFEYLNLFQNTFNGLLGIHLLILVYFLLGIYHRVDEFLRIE